MKIKTVSVTFGENRSAKWQSGRIEVGLSADIDEREDPEEVRIALLETCKAAVRSSFYRFHAEKMEEAAKLEA